MVLQANSTTERRLAWHPRHLNRFIVAGGSQITLYECAPAQPEIRHITSQNDLHLMKCFTWSPEPLFDDLLAIGHSNGRVDLIRMESSRYTGADNILSNGPVVSLPVKNQRACNTLAFSGKDPNYLAVGLDKVRGDASLVIWDVNSALPILSFGTAVSGSSTINSVDTINQVLRSRPTPTIPRAEHGTKFDHRMLQVHATTEYVSSLTFLPDSSHLLLAGISSRWLRLFDLRARTSSAGNTNLHSGTGGGAVANIASKVHGVATDPFDQHRVASWGDGVVTVWDTRNLNSGPLLTFTERDGAADGGISPTAQLTSSASTTSLASLPRKGTGLISGSIPERATPPYVSVEFSANRRGQLATLAKETPYVRFWDILEASVSSAWSTTQTDVFSHNAAGDLASGNSDKSPAGDRGRLHRDRQNSIGSTAPGGRKQTLSLPKRSWPNFPSWGGRGTSPSIERETSKESSVTTTSLVLSDTRKTYPFLPVTVAEYLSQPRNLTSFALVPNSPFYDRTQHGTSNKIVLITSTGELALQTLYDAPKAEAAWSARGHIGGIGFVHTEAQEASPDTVGVNMDPPSQLIDKSKSKSQSQSHPKSEDYAESSRDRSRGSAPTRSLGDSELSKRTQKSKEVQSSKLHVATFAAERGRRQIKATGTSETEEFADAWRDPTYALVMDDISTTMRRRARKGYGFGDALHNATLVMNRETSSQSRSLSSLWTWIHHTQTHLHTPTPYVQGYDFTYQGVWGIWNGLLLGKDSPTASASQTATTGTNSPMESVSADATPVHRNTDLPLLSVEGSILGEPLKRPVKHNSRWKKRHSHTEGAVSSSPSPILTPPNRETTWQVALKEIATRFSSLGSQATVRVATSKMLQRQVCLGLLAWENEALVGFDSRPVRSGTSQTSSRDELSRVACWLVFFGQWEKAVEMLTGSNDETHHLVSATITALAPASTGQSHPSPVSAHYSRLRARVQDPYLWALLTYLTTRDVSAILGIREEGEPERTVNIAFRERLALAFIFLDDRALTSYIRRYNQMAKDPGQIDIDDGLDLIIVTGLASSEGREVLSRWVDKTADIQSVALLGWMGLSCNVHFQSNAKTDRGKVARARGEDKKRVERWVEMYRDLLDSWRMFHERVEFDIERGEIGQRVLRENGSEAELPMMPKQIIIRCNYCNKPVTPIPNVQGELPAKKGKSSVCPNCSRGLPRCSVCLLALSIVQDPVRDAQLMGYESVNQRDTIEEAIVICQTCRHGGHLSHISGWFFGEEGEGPSHHVCPVANCDCRCANHF